jgi:hypothetical protein
MFVASVRSFQRLDQLEQIQFTEGYSAPEMLLRLKVITDQKIRLNQSAANAYQLLVSMRPPSITILTGQTQVNLNGSASR